MRRPYLLILALLLAALPLSGCWSFKTLEHMAYIHALGVDYRDGQYTIYAQIANFTNIAKTDVGGQQNENVPVWVGKASGKSFNVAIFNLYDTLQRRLYWSHLSTLVFTESAAKKGIEEIRDLFQRFGEFRPTFWVFTTNIRLEKLFTAAAAVDPSPVYSKLGDPIDMNKQSSFPALPKRMHEFVALFREESHTLVIPSLKVDKKSWFDQKKYFEEIVFDGYSVMHRGKWMGMLSSEEARGLLWLNRNLVRSPLSIRLSENSVSSVVVKKPTIKIIPIFEQDQVRFSLHLKLNGHFTQLKGISEEDEIRKKVRETIQAQVLRTYRAGLKIDADVLNLSDTVYRKHSKDWKRLSKNGKLPLDENSLAEIKVEIKFIHYGKKVHMDAKQ